MAPAEEAKLVVGIDMGTTFSGFAFAHRDQPDKIYSFYEWPGCEGRPYCKTQTSLHYVKKASGEFALTSWGWPAQACHLRQKDGDEGGERSVFLTKFKLHLAPRQADPGACTFKDPSNHIPSSSRSGRAPVLAPTAPPLPVGLSVVTVISDYLAKLSAFTVSHLQETYGGHITSRDLQWCLTVPAIWDDSAKQVMRNCAQMAGMVTGPHCPRESAAAASPHPLRIVLESEAASLYCAKNFKQLRLQKGDRFVVADLGGGTTDIVVHTRDNDDDSELRLRETSRSSGDLCGGTNVDLNLLLLLSTRIGCLEEWLRLNPSSLTRLMRRWGDIKATYGDGSDDIRSLELPPTLSRAWRLHDKANPPASGNADDTTNYDEIELRRSDMMQIFDPVVSRIVELIRQQLTTGMTLLLLVGGFSSSPYLRKRIKDAFADVLNDRIVMPSEPGSAVCHGAVIFGLCPRVITSRVSRKTYGVKLLRPFIPSSDPQECLVVTDRGPRCANSFKIFVRKGEHVAIDQCVKRNILPVVRKETSLSVSIYSTDAVDVNYTTDPGVVLEGEFEVDISDDLENLDLARRLQVSMYLGTSCIQVQARRLNFGNMEEVIEMHRSIGLELN